MARIDKFLVELHERTLRRADFCHNHHVSCAKKGAISAIDLAQLHANLVAHNSTADLFRDRETHARLGLFDKKQHEQFAMPFAAMLVDCVKFLALFECDGLRLQADCALLLAAH